MTNEETKKTDRELNTIPKALDHLLCLVMDKYKKELIEILGNFFLVSLLFFTGLAIFDFLNITFFVDILFK